MKPAFFGSPNFTGVDVNVDHKIAEFQSDFNRNPYARNFIQVRGLRKATKAMLEQRMIAFDLVILLTGEDIVLCSERLLNEQLMQDFKPQVVPSESVIRGLLGAYYSLQEFTIQQIEGFKNADDFLFMNNFEEESCVGLYEEKIAKIGDKECGGIIFYVDGTGKHGLVVAENDFSDNDFTWQSALMACSNFKLSGYADWYLPGKDELNQIQQARDVIGKLKHLYYWSATSIDKNDAWSLDTYHGTFILDDKNMKLNVILIRAF
ncbi:MAG: DUF1566 domain-containing protein [Candidatus Moraniibacteriota bacterium]